jgi:hypothetical protein
MDEKATGSSGAVKLILVSAGVFIVLLVVMKQLKYNPIEVITGSVHVKFQPLVPPQQQVTPEATAELEKKIQELQQTLQNSNTTPSKTTPYTPPGETQATSINIAGYWRAYPYNVQIAQSGDQLGITVFYPNGLPGLACYGMLSGKSLNLKCTNGMTSTDATGAVIGNNRIEVTDYSLGYPQQWTLTR